MSSDGSKIIPFGKYIGKTWEILRNDHAYCEWLKAQPSMAEKYPDLLSYLSDSTNITTPILTESVILPTPQHNRVQAQFLARNFTSKFFQYVTGIDPEGNRTRWNVVSDFFQPEFFNKAGLPITQIRSTDSLTYILNERIIIQLVDWFTNLKFEGVNNCADVEFIEPCYVIDCVPKVLLGWSLKISGTQSTGEEMLIRNLLQPHLPDNIFIPQVLIEIKPQMGDDYPRVLHLMKQRGHNILYLQQYESAAVNLGLMKELFNRDGILVVMENELSGKIRKKDPMTITPPCKIIKKVRFKVEDCFTNVNIYGLPIIIYDQIMYWLQHEQGLSIEVIPYPAPEVTKKSEEIKQDRAKLVQSSRVKTLEKREKRRRER